MPEAHTISLCDALLDLRCVPASAPLAERRRVAAAAQLVHATLSRFALAETKIDADRDDLVITVALRLAERGPRRGRPTMPTDDAGAARYLRRAVRNAAHDIRRKHKRQRVHQAFEKAEAARLQRDAVQGGGDAHDAERVLSEQESGAQRAAELAQAEAWIDRQVTALVAAKNARRAGTGDALARQLDELRRAAQGALDIGALARQQAPPGADAATLKRARNKLDAGYKRARRTLYDHVEAALVTHPRPELIRWVFHQRVSLQ